MDVISGALAVAGSSFSFVKAKGSKSPIKQPTLRVITMDDATTKRISGAL